ncbi:leucine--tRNA ligase [Candidatus Saccharibacteria bacterium RIFCSPHIGHO2_02_FULL_47_12]|nr:MAG: leucine--tRNA ligase [Candidatus Saccharibacteria bacterium RIFCSPHIGHO2_02_FULL_47_12]
MKRYNPKEIEPKWQAKWEEQGIYRAEEDSKKPKKYVLEYFPYPSGAAMHVGHVRNYTIGDAMARHARMSGYNVLHPMGWDAFGLPAENYAIKNKISPRKAIDENTSKFKKQLMQMGFSYDWSREIDSTDPKYYKWTQWFFLMLFKRGLAYQQESLQWWCPVDKTVLANEQVEAGKCWRCGNEVEKKALNQWFFKITDYADRLEADLEDLNWSESIKSMQRNWIGRSVGAEVEFKVEGSKDSIKVFTTRIDTLFSGAFLVLAPEHPLVMQITDADHKTEVTNYVKQAQAKSDIERQEDEKEKTGVFTGSYAINPANDEKLPIWVADFVLGGYGTGAIFGDIHDERDFEFIMKFDIPAKVSVMPEDKVHAKEVLSKKVCFTGEGTLINSDQFDGLSSSEAREQITAWLAKKGSASERVNYKLRDWLISRQRYWGAPIPIIHCPEHGPVAVPDDQLPVELPEIKSYEPSGEGRSPLAGVSEFVNTTCPTCGKPAQRETDTMDGFACSSWYFLRFADPHNAGKPFDRELVERWLPVDDYIGGAEHAVMHLLYARFWTKVMYDEGLITFQEPFTTLRNQGMILAPDGQKMSKSKGNTIEPDGLIDQGYGADATRLMELFIGPWNQSAAWSVEGMGGVYRFLQRVWTICQEYLAPESKEQNVESKELQAMTHKTIFRVSKDLEELGFNTAIAALMEFVNELYKIKAEKGMGKTKNWEFALQTLVQLLAPFAPHIAEELWQELGQEGSVHQSAWPVHDDKYLLSDTVTIVVQVNGRVRANIELPSGSDESAVVEAAKKDKKVAVYLAGKEAKKTIYIPGKLVNIVV